MENMVDASDKNFNELLSSSKLAIVHFSANRCFPCSVVASSIEEVAPNHKSVLFMKADIDQCKSLADRFGVMNVPTLIIFKEGRAIERVFGNVPKPYLEHLLKKHLDEEGVSYS